MKCMMPSFLARYERVIKQFAKFFITGGTGAIVDFSIYNALYRFIGLHTVLIIFGQQLRVANLISVFCAIIWNFILNKFWTFSDHGGSLAGQWTGYFTLNVVTFILNQFITSFFIYHVPIYQQLFGSQVDNAAKATAIGLILFVNFFGSKFLIFRTKAPVYRQA